jgi:hypothetical protein
MSLGFQDNLGNILGANTASNLYDSSSVTADADGSIIERLEVIQQKVGAVDSTSNPIGANDADNGFDSSSVVSNADGSVLERLESIQQKVGAVDAADNILGANDADNGFSSSSVVGNANGSILERIEYLQDELAGTGIAADIATVQTEVDKIGTISNAGGTATIGGALGAVANNSIVDRLADIQTEVDKIGTPAGADVSADIAAISTLVGTPVADVSADIAAIKAQTDEIGSAVGVSISADIAAVQAEVDKIGTPTGADVSTDIASNKTAIDNFAAAGGFGKAIARKTVTFSNTNADVNLFTVTGTVIARIVSVCTTVVASAGTCNISVYSGSATMIAQTASTDIAAGEIWHDASPDAEAELLTVAPDYIISDGNDIVLDIEGAHQVDSGVLEFYVIYTPLSADGAVAAA